MSKTLEERARVFVDSVIGGAGSEMECGCTKDNAIYCPHDLAAFARAELERKREEKKKRAKEKADRLRIANQATEDDEARVDLSEDRLERGKQRYGS